MRIRERSSLKPVGKFKEFKNCKNAFIVGKILPYGYQVW
jgi:hypothetical protein